MDMGVGVREWVWLCWGKCVFGLVVGRKEWVWVWDCWLIGVESCVYG